MGKTIFSLLDTPAYGGAEEYLCSVLFGLHDAGYHVVLATNNSQVKAHCAKKLTVIKLPYRLDMIGNWKGLLKFFFYAPGAVWWLTDTILRLHMKDLVCLFPGFSDRLLFSPFVRLFGATLIWLEYGPLEPTFARNFGIPKFFYMLAKKFPHNVVTISQWTKQSLMRTGKIRCEKISVIYPGVSVPKNISKKKNKTNIITVARLAKEKEIDLLLHAFSIVRVSARLIIIGDGPERKRLEQLAKRLGLKNRVRFTGFVSEQEKYRLLQSSAVFVFPSAWELEGFGMTTIEAMAHGALVVSSGYGPQGEIVSDGKTGILFAPHTIHALAKAIERALDQPTDGNMQRNARTRIEKSFSKDRMLSAWKKLVTQTHHTVVVE